MPIAMPNLIPVMPELVMTGVAIILLMAELRITSYNVCYTKLLRIKVAVVIVGTLLHVAYATYWERKVIGHMQLRLGPREVGPFGLLQPFADGVKLFFKEDIII